MARVSYTFRMPIELKKLLEAKALEHSQSLASCIVGALWARVDSGVAQSAELIPHKDVVAGSIPAPATKQKRMPPAKRLPDGPDGDHRFDRSNQPPLLDSTIKASPLLQKIEVKQKRSLIPITHLPSTDGRPTHNPKTCRTYLCGMCALVKG